MSAFLTDSIITVCSNMLLMDCVKIRALNVVYGCSDLIHYGNRYAHMYRMHQNTIVFTHSLVTILKFDNKIIIFHYVTICISYFDINISSLSAWQKLIPKQKPDYTLH